MTNPFQDQAHFMKACDQSVGEFNGTQFDMYCSLIDEEHKELHTSLEKNDNVECLDALIDILVVTIGAIHSMGADGEGAWNEVMRTNLSKIDSVTGKVLKRDDGKILKPEGWTPPNLTTYLGNKL